MYILIIKIYTNIKKNIYCRDLESSLNFSSKKTLERQINLMNENLFNCLFFNRIGHRNIGRTLYCEKNVLADPKKEIITKHWKNLIL